MEFDVRTTLGRQELMDYQRISGRTIQKGRTTGTRAALIVVGLVGLTACGVAIGSAGFNGAVLFGVALCTVCFALGVGWYSFQAWKTGRKVADGLEQRFFFTEEGVVAKAAGQQVVHGYRDFIALAETEGYFCLFVSPRSGYLLPKSGFTKGDPKEFGAFIQRKTGKDLPFAKI